ncbi:unnamed protein product [Effrenium voratum]|uniref:JmjC domain-containing protein n=1 Tax=Effrenium voratum TaxID=2562239 RepID=A0AA36N2R0_9DINO|nr:unnamed protein product [Effrenium voratum]
MTRLVGLLLGQVWHAASEVRGHLQPFGGWADGEPVEERGDVPDPEDFYTEYCTSDGGHGRPVVFRGAAASWKAIKWTDDEDLLWRFGSQRVTGVEHNLKETRAGGQVDGMNTFGDFLNAYNNSDIYMVSNVPKKMMKEVEFLRCMECGGYLRFLDTQNFWMGRGGSKSVVHYDDQDNINCMLAGEKRFVFMHPSYKKDFEAHPNSAKNRFGWVDTDLDRSIPGYGAFMRIDVDKVDLIKYPGWRDVKWSYADLRPGDCIYIPYQWYHQVTAKPGRSINVHVWYWRPAAFDAESCKSGAGPTTFADCSWGYEPKKGHLGKVQKGGKKPTKCKKATDRQRGLEL